MFLPDWAIKELANGRPAQKTAPIPQSTYYAQVLDVVYPKHDKEHGVDLKMIEPFTEDFVRKVEGGNVPSFGQSGFGYDVKLSDDIEIFSNLNGGVIDPLNHDQENLAKAQIKTDEKGHRYFMLPPNSYALGYTLEYFNMPSRLTAMCLGKSTYARCGIVINVTPIEAGFSGQVVIEISNSATLPNKIYLDGGIAQFMFVLGWDECEKDYSVGDRKYQGQVGLTYAKG